MNPVTLCWDPFNIKLQLPSESKLTVGEEGKYHSTSLMKHFFFAMHLIYRSYE